MQSHFGDVFPSESSKRKKLQNQRLTWALELPIICLLLKGLSFCDPAGIRTQDHYIKSVMLYQLSYGISLL